MLAENLQNGMVRLKEGGEGRGLFPVLQPQGNPYAESHPTGDAWLQSMWKEGDTEVLLLAAYADALSPATTTCAPTVIFLLVCISMLWSN